MTLYNGDVYSPMKAGNTAKQLQYRQKSLSERLYYEWDKPDENHYKLQQK